MYQTNTNLTVWLGQAMYPMEPVSHKPRFFKAPQGLLLRVSCNPSKNCKGWSSPKTSSKRGNVYGGLTQGAGEGSQAFQALASLSIGWDHL